MFYFSIVLYFYCFLLLIANTLSENVTKSEISLQLSNSSVTNSTAEDVFDEEVEPIANISETVAKVDNTVHGLDNSLSHFLDSGVTFLSEARNVFNEELNESNSDSEAKDVWIAYSKSWGHVFDALIKDIVPKALESSGDIDISLDCIGAIIATVNGLKAQKDWAVKLFDSTGRPFSAGSLDGTITNYGAYDQCLSIETPSESSMPFIGQYCVVKYRIALPPKPKHLTLRSKVLNFTGTPVEGTFLEVFSRFAHAFYERYGRTGICVPSVCTESDIGIFLKRFISEKQIKLTVNDCHTKVLPQFNALQTTIVFIFCALLVLMTIATSFDLIFHYTEDRNQFIRVEHRISKLFWGTLLVFSVYKNGKILFNTTTHSSNSSIECINGIRVLSMVWILWTHTYLIPIKESFTFVRDFMFTVEELGFQLILNGWVLVDSFFLVGAMLTTYSLFHRLEQTDGQINVLQQILNRIFRFLPSVSLTVMLIFLIPSLTSGPLWKEYFDIQVDKCYKNWWTTIVFINNWYDESRMCLLHTWYLSADIQLFIISLAFIITLYKRPSLGIKLIAMGAMASALAIAVRTYLLKQNPTVLYNTPNERDVYTQASTIYIHTYIHLSPYFIGLILGYVVFKYKALKINPFLNLFVWLSALLGCLSIMLSTHTLNKGMIWPPIAAAVYAGLHRTAWALCVAWIIFGCSSGNGGPINTFLSWKLFTPLGKLSFMIYLMHFLVIWVRYAYLRQPLPFSHYTMFCEFIVNLVLSIGVSIVTHLSFEAPMMSLYRLYLSNIFKFANFRINAFNQKSDKTAVQVNNSAIIVTSKM